jgi:tetratricopeptide (TPR) repeat protein
MRGQITFVALVLGTLLVIAGPVGCAPTKSGIENRAAASARMSLVGAQVHYEQAQQHFATGQLDKAIKEIDHAIERYPDMGAYHLLKGRILVEQSRLEQALVCFDTAIEKAGQPAPQAALNTSESSKAGASKSLSPTNASIVADAHYYAGVVYQRWSDDEQAYNCYLQAFTVAPDKVHYLLAAAESLIALGEYGQAEQLIDPKLAYFEHNASLRQLQAQIAMLQGDARKAAGIYADARLLNPDDTSLLEEMMWAQWAAGLYAQCYESASTVKLKSQLSDDSDPMTVTSASNQSANSRSLNTSSTARPDITLLQARCLAMMGRGVEARELYLQLAKVRPTDAALWAELGTLAWELGDYRSLAQASTQLLAIAPDRYEGYLFRAVNERHKGNTDECVRLLRETCQRAAGGSGVALPFLMLGQALEQQGDMEGARVAYNGALSADPNSPEAAAVLRRFNEGSQHVTAAPEE